MNSLLHALNIGTLATWLSVAGVGTVGLALPSLHRPPELVIEASVEAVVDPYDFSLGAPSPPDSAAAEGDGEGAEVTPEAAEPLDLADLPPELPEIADLLPLPEIPNLPPPKPKPATGSSRATPTVKPAASPPRTSTGGGSPNSGKPAAGGQPGGSGMSSAARLAAGRMPAPSYPAAARRQGQTGTVVVEFTIDTSGRVISAVAISPSRWPLLNDEAVRTVRRWKFPPGPVMKLQRPIIFQLR